MVEFPAVFFTVQAMKAEYNSLAPVCATCLDNSRSLSSLCDPGDPKTALDDHTSRLHDDWEKLGALFGDILAKLTEALVQTQEFKSIAGTPHVTSFPISEEENHAFTGLCTII